MSKPDIFLSASSKDGLFIAEVVHTLRDKGYDVTAQQLRDYQKEGLFTSEKTKGGFRVYDKTSQEKIMRVYDMKLTGMSLREMKEFCMTEKKIASNPLINVRKEWDSENSMYIFIREVKPGFNKENANNREFVMLIKNYNSSCDEIKNRLLKVRSIAEDGLKRISLQKVGISK